MRAIIILLSIFTILLGKENKLQLTINVTEPNINYSYLGEDFYETCRPKNMDSNMVNYGDTGLKILEITCTNENISSLENMFYDCSDIIFINLTDFDTSNIIDMKSMFAGCTSLESLDLSKFNTSNVEDMSVMFAECNSLKALNISNFDTSNVEDMSVMFAGCTSLESLLVCLQNVIL